MTDGTFLPEKRPANHGMRPVPPLARKLWSHLPKGEGASSVAEAAKKIPKPGLMSFEPLFAFCLMDPFMRFTQVSPAVAELTGYSVGELCCMGVQEVVALDSLEAIVEAFDKVDHLGWSHFLVPFYRKDGVRVEARVDTIRLAEDRYMWWIREVRIPAGAMLKL